MKDQKYSNTLKEALLFIVHVVSADISKGPPGFFLAPLLASGKSPCVTFESAVYFLKLTINTREKTLV